MGWSTWNVFGCDISEEKIKAQADALVAAEWMDKGFKYILIDDCWQNKARNDSGFLHADPIKFPNGMKAVADYIHEIGLRFGIYSSAGTKTCAGFPGSLGYETQDAALWAEWEVDYLKYDNCYNEGISAEIRYNTMGAALNETNRNIFYSICNWGNENVITWAPKIAQSWRTTIDINIGTDTSNAFYQMQANFMKNQVYNTFAGPGGWNDPDMLLLGFADMSPSESFTHFAMWCFAKAPLILSTDMTNLGNVTDSNSTAWILSQSHLLHIN